MKKRIKLSFILSQTTQQYYTNTLNFKYNYYTKKITIYSKFTFLLLYWKISIKRLYDFKFKYILTSCNKYIKHKFIFLYSNNFYNYINIFIKSASLLKYSLILVKFNKINFYLFKQLYINILFKYNNFIFIMKYFYFKNKIKLIKH